MYYVSMHGTESVSHSSSTHTDVQLSVILHRTKNILP
jgi:hypothetical protein